MSAAIDPDNPVVQLCAEGMRLEGQGLPREAAEQFDRAWALADSAYERCIAAHYVARHQPTPQASLEWNSRCLELAEQVRAQGQGELVTGFYPSLHLNIGHSHEQLGDLAAARAGYLAAERAIGELGPGLGEGRYAELLLDGVHRALERTSGLAAADIP